MELDLEKFAAPKPPKLERQQIDLDLWKKWDDNGRKPEDLRPLLSRFRGMIRSKANNYSGVEIPPVAVHAEFNRQFAKAVQSYNPNKGAALGTWVGLQLKKSGRWINQRQNTARIAEGLARQITDYNVAQNSLDNQFGRPPTDLEVADYMGIGVKTVQRLRKQQRDDLMPSGFVIDPTEIKPSKEKEIMAMLPYDLDRDELFVYEHSLGVGGKPKLNGNEIARKLGVSPSTVSRLKKAIADKAKNYM